VALRASVIRRGLQRLADSALEKAHRGENGRADENDNRAVSRESFDAFHEWLLVKHG
jgi:hypothetical protein